MADHRYNMHTHTHTPVVLVTPLVLFSQPVTMHHFIGGVCWRGPVATHFHSQQRSPVVIPVQLLRPMAKSLTHTWYVVKCGSNIRS